jgi:cation-transporting ATPase E
MTGDGVNDVPALKQAEVSVAVKSGSPVTRSVADIVLLNDSFAVLPAAFSEGQRIRKGMESIIRLFLVRTFAVSLAILGVSVLTDPFPITPRQAGIPALFTVGLPALALAVWAKPAKTGRYLLPSAALFVIPASLTIGITSLCLYHFYLEETGELVEAQTMMVLISTLCGITLVAFVQDAQQDWLRVRGLVNEFRGLALAVAMLLALAVSYLVPPFRSFYELELLPFEAYGVLALTFASWYAVLFVLWRINWDPAYQATKERLLALRRRPKVATPSRDPSVGPE